LTPVGAGVIVRRTMVSALQGVRVLDLSNGMAGELVGMMLSDNGANVIKIDAPGTTDRYLPGELVWNRGKKSAHLDIKSPKGRAAFLRLVDKADVLIETFKPGTTKRLRIDYATLAKRNKRLVYTTITGYGSKSTLKDRPGYDALIQARIGLMDEQPQHAARPAVKRDGPIMIALPLPSIGAFFMATYATIAALIAREKTGTGQHVESSLFQGMLANMTMRWWRTEKGGALGPGAMVNGKMVPWLPTIFHSKDGIWFYNMGTRRFREDFAKFMELPEAPQAIPPNIPEQQQFAMYEHFQSIYDKYTWAQLDRIFEKLDCIVLPVQHASKTFDDPQVAHNKFIVEVDDPRFGRLREVGVSFTMTRSPAKVQGAAHVPGADTESVLKGAGLSKAEIATLGKK